MADQPACPAANRHTKAPADYLAWHAWADRKARTHAQERCSTCGLWAIWRAKPKAGAV